MLFNLGDQHSIISVFLAELRDVRNHNDRLRFRKNMERLGEIVAYEISKKLSYTKGTIETPLEKAEVYNLSSVPVIIAILRAGIPFMQGLTNFFDNSDCGFIGAYRQEDKDNFKINMDYCATPELTAKHVIIADPMLATGSSVMKTINSLSNRGVPAHYDIASVIAAPEGIENLINFFRNEVKVSFRLWTCAVDAKLNSDYYIVPGLGDAGDLSFGKKEN